MLNITQVETGVLVIGGGGAGARAALEAYGQGAKVALAMKGKFGQSGATAFKAAETAGLNVADGTVDPADNPGEHFADIRNAALGVCDERLACILTQEALELIPFLEGMGIRLEMDGPDYLTVAGCFANRSRMHILKGHGEPIVRALKEEIARTGIQLYESVTVVDLVVDEGICAGAIALDENGDLLLFSARSVILATGGAGQLFAQTLSPPDITGDGYAMGYRCGAELMNLEFMQVGLGTVHPMKNLLHCWVWGLHPRVLNGEGNQFLADYQPDGVSVVDVMNTKTLHYPFSSRDNSRYLELAIQKEIRAGRAAPHGGVFVDFTEIDETVSSGVPRRDEIAKMWAITKQWYLSRMDIDLEREPLEIGIFAHAINGGLRVDEHGQTTIRRLYAVGETAAGPHGADRLGGNMLVGCQVFGKRAGVHAARQAQIAKHTAIPKDVIQDALAKLERWAGNRNDSAIGDLRLQLQKAMSDNALLARNDERLRSCLIEIERIRADLNTRARVETAGDLSAAMELDNSLVVAEMIVQAALTREESRGSHYREDFLTRNDSDWNKAIVLRKRGEEMELLREFLPVIEVC